MILWSARLKHRRLGLMHRDLKPANVLYRGGGNERVGEEISYKLADFGLSVQLVGSGYNESDNPSLDETDRARLFNARGVVVEEDVVHRTKAGTKAYMAPEVMNRTYVRVAADVVEVSPPYDSSDITSIAAVDVIFEFLCLMS